MNVSSRHSRKIERRKLRLMLFFFLVTRGNPHFETHAHNQKNISLMN
ncbi:hypothetical protein LJPFL01_2804 [Lelliottia jeotgali]|nr:hypothetical protein LJPFL01_2804 [Lelliottia jeotgali]